MSGAGVAGRRPGAGGWLGGAVAFLLALPVLVGIGYAALGALDVVGFASGEASLARTARVLGERATWRGVLMSLWVGLASTALAAGGATALALLFRGRGRTDRVARALAVLPLPLPHLVAAAGAVLVLAQSGLLGRLLVALGAAAGPADVPALVYDGAGVGMILAFAWKELPFLALVAFTVLGARATDAEEAARTLGARPRDVARRVTLPLLWRGLLPAAVAAFIFVAGNYEAAALLAPSDPAPLPVLAYERWLDPDLARRGDAYVLTLVALLLGVVAVAAHETARARQRT